jgi:hypothetical protein
MKRCSNAHQYTGEREPRCAGGEGCDACARLYAQKHKGWKPPVRQKPKKG